jgi:bla regulator protein BlaR1
MEDFIGNHLWQSTLFAAAASFLTVFFRKNHARIRFRLWLAASLKFLIPFSFFMAIGSSFDFDWKQSVPVHQPAVSFIQDFSQPFKSIEVLNAVHTASTSPPFPLLPTVLAATWFCGFLAVLMFYLRKRQKLQRVVRSSEPIKDGRVLEILQALECRSKLRKCIRPAMSASSIGPGVFGIFRPVLLLPEGIVERLKDSELEAVIAHEVVHIRRYDNLIALIHMVIEALFWFHPMIWWLGAKLVQERERACDEEVLRLGKNPQSYAEGILKVCEFYLESPLRCVSGVTGGDMKKRIQSIMVREIGHKLNPAGKLLLAAAGFAVLAFPVLAGILYTPVGRAQSQGAPKPTFEVASVKPAEVCGNEVATRLKIPQGQGFQPGGYYSKCSVLKWIISDAYRTELPLEITGGPGWINDTLYRIEAKALGNPDKETMQLMLQSLLEDRFSLKLGYESQEAPVYFLVVAEGGPKLQPAKDEQGNPIESLPSPEQMKEAFEKRMEQMKKTQTSSQLIATMPPGSSSIAMFPDGHRMTGKALSMEALANSLAGSIFPTTGRRVIDKTGITGLYDIQLRYKNPFQTRTGLNQSSPAADESHVPTAEPAVPTIYTALEEQLGLKLEKGKAPLKQIVIDSAERPTEN